MRRRFYPPAFVIGVCLEGAREMTAPGFITTNPVPGLQKGRLLGPIG